MDRPEAKDTTKPDKPMTARELARLIGVSQSAVSRAFSPGSSISPELRERILKSSRDLDYQPNAIASMLSTRRSFIVGIVISEMQNPFYPALIEKLTRALQAIGLQSLLFNVTRGANIEEQLTALRKYNVDAVVVISATLIPATTLAWATEGRSAVLVNRTVPDSNLTSVTCDNSAGARLIADHFHAIGRRHVAFVGGLPNTTTNLQRQSAFITRVAELGMTLTANLSGGEYTYEAGYRTAQQIGRDRKTEAVFFANDILALGGMDALRDECRLSVPGDIAVAGFDDIGMARWPRYQLTTLRQPVDSIVDTTVRLIADGEVEPGRPVKTHVLPCPLIVRQSTAGRDNAEGKP